MKKQQRIIARARFERGADIYRAGKVIYRVPQCTLWDDPNYRVVTRGNRAVAQKERREYSGGRVLPTGVWQDVEDLGDVRSLVIHEDHPRGCRCSECEDTLA